MVMQDISVIKRVFVYEFYYIIDFGLVGLPTDHACFNLCPITPPAGPIGLTGTLIRSYRIFAQGIFMFTSPTINNVVIK